MLVVAWEEMNGLCNVIVFFSFNDFFLVLDDIVGGEWGTVLRLIIGYKRRCTIINIEVGSEWYLCGTPFAGFIQQWPELDAGELGGHCCG